MSDILVTKRRRRGKKKGSRDDLSKKKEMISNLEREKYVLIQSIKVADTCIEEGNIELETLTKGKVTNIETN